MCHKEFEDRQQLRGACYCEGLGSHTRLVMLGFSPLFRVFVLLSPPLRCSQFSGSRKGGLSKGLNAQNRLLYREMDCPVQWSLATPSALESQSRANQGSVVCKCRCHKAGHLQVRVAGSLGLPQIHSLKPYTPVGNSYLPILYLFKLIL